METLDTLARLNQAVTELTRRDPVTGAVEALPASERIRRIIEHPQAEALVRNMDAQSVFALIDEVGRDDALELIELASPEQVQAFIDFDCWERDAIVLGEFSAWLDLLLQCDDERFAELYRTMDIEAFVIWVRETIAIFEWEEDIDLLDTIDDPVYTSPDGQYALVIPEEEAHGPQLRLFLERLYALDLEEALRVMFAARWEVTSDLAERLFEERTARLADLGIVPWYEAGEVYAWLPPQQWVAEVQARLAAQEHVEVLAAGELPPLDTHLQVLEEDAQSPTPSFFAAALARVVEVVDDGLVADSVDAIMSQLRALIARRHAASGGKIGDAEGTRRTTRRCVGAMSIALEMVAGADPRTGARVLLSEPLKMIHRAGFSATAQLGKQAREMVQRGNLTLTDAPTSLLVDADAELMEGLCEARPLLSFREGRSFQSFADVQYAAGRLGQIAFSELLFFAWMGFSRDDLAEVIYNEEMNATPVEQVSFRVLFATLLLNQLVDAERALTPLAHQEVIDAVHALHGKDDALAYLIDRGRKLVRRLQPKEAELTHFGDRFVAESAFWLHDELEGKIEEYPWESLTSLVLLAPRSTT